MNNNEPLFLPKGSIRAIIAILMVLGTIVVFLVTGAVPVFLITATSIITVFYFGTRTFLNK